MAQNINIVQYIQIQNPGAQQDPQGRTYQLPPNSLAGVIGAKWKNPETGKQKIKTHKAFIGITENDAGEALYGDLRDTVKDQMLARNYAEIKEFPNAEVQQIVASMRRLLPVWHALATASATNNINLMQEIDEGVIQIVKDCGKKLTNTLGKRVPGAPPPWNPGVLPAQVSVRGTILPLGAPAQWGPVTAGPNASLVPKTLPQRMTRNLDPPTQSMTWHNLGLFAKRISPVRQGESHVVLRKLLTQRIPIVRQRESLLPQGIASRNPNLLTL